MADANEEAYNMTRLLKTITCIALVGIDLLAARGFSEEVVVKQNEWDKTPYWRYVFDAQDGARVFLHDGRVLSFWFKKATKESTFEVHNPVFKVSGDLKPRHRYAIIGDELFATYRIDEEISGESVSRSYVYSIKGLDKASTPTIQGLGLFSRANTQFLQVAKIGKDFVALTYDFAAETKMIEVYDEYKRGVGKYPAIGQSISLCYSRSKNTLYFVNPLGLLTELPMDSLFPTTFSFDEPLPDFNPEQIRNWILPFAWIVAKGQQLTHLYYVIPHNREESFLLEADLDAKKVRQAAALPHLHGRYIGKVSAFNERFVYVFYLSAPEGESRSHLFDIIDKKFIPLKAFFYPYPKWCITMERPLSTPYLLEKAGDDYIFKFFDNFAFDDASIDLIQK